MARRSTLAALCSGLHALALGLCLSRHHQRHLRLELLQVLKLQGLKPPDLRELRRPLGSLQFQRTVLPYRPRKELGFVLAQLLQ